MATVRENLIAAKALIDTPEKLSRGAHEPFPADGKFTIHAAVDRVCWRKPRQFVDASDALREQLWGGERSLKGFNRHQSHADIMALFDRAIASQEPLPSDE